jgi:hypothetical protein
MKYLPERSRVRLCLTSFFVAVIVLLAGSTRTQASAPLNYSADTTISLTTPAVNLTIKSGSVADQIIVNSGNVAITMSSSTGGTFALTSPQSLGSSISGSGGTVDFSCSSGIQTATITQTSNSATYTLTPSGSACTSGGGGGGGGGGGTFGVPAGQIGTSTPPAVPTSTSVNASTSTPTFVGLGPLANTSSTTDFLQQLLALVKQVRTLSIEMLQTIPARNLTIGVKGQDVWAIQVFLITNNILAPLGPTTAKLVSPTSYFGFITGRSLAEYQANVGIAPAQGYFGPKTRTYLASTYLPSGNPIAPAPTPAPSAAPAATSQLFLKPLRWSMHDPDVARLQAFLAKNQAIYPEGVISGYFGDATLAAVRRFQLKYGLAHDGDIFYGYVGPQTRAKLNALLSAGLTP